MSTNKEREKRLNETPARPKKQVSYDFSTVGDVDARRMTNDTKNNKKNSSSARATRFILSAVACRFNSIGSGKKKLVSGAFFKED